MYKVGITGGIGSGKSTVAKIFEVLGIPVYYADDEAKKIMETNAEVRQKLITAFGSDCYNQQGLNRQYLRQLIFNDSNNSQKINAIVHPITIAQADTWLQQQNTPYALKEAALIFESNAHQHLDFIIGVAAPQALRIKRVMQRDGISEEEVLARMQKQMNEDEKMSKCDAIINNDDTILLIPQVMELHNRLIGLASKS
jgi:dephospho-CoA kinase